eukprot:4292081-Pyramimonas_sp.AAC.2
MAPLALSYAWIARAQRQRTACCRRRPAGPDATLPPPPPMLQRTRFRGPGVGGDAETSRYNH